MSTKEENPQHIRDAFTKRLNLALREAGIAAYGSGVLIADACNITPKAAGKWLNSMSIPRASKMTLLCEWLQVRREWLEYGVEPMKEESLGSAKPASAASFQISLISKSSILQLLAGDDIKSQPANAEIAQALGASSKTFAYIETSEGMMHRITPKDTVYIDPEGKLEPNSLGIFLFKIGADCQLGTLKSTPGGLMLQFDSSEPGWESIAVSEDDYIGRLVAYVPHWLSQ
jgi:hypothetical protein